MKYENKDCSRRRYVSTVSFSLLTFAVTMSRVLFQIAMLNSSLSAFPRRNIALSAAAPMIYADKKPPSIDSGIFFTCIICKICNLLPFHRGRRFRSNIIDYAVDARDFVCDAVRDAGEKVIGDFCPVRRHKIVCRNGAQHD